MKDMVYTTERKFEVLDCGYFEGYHYAIISYGTHPCAYVELPENHPYYKKDYNRIPIACHFGLTYSENGLLPKNNDEHFDGYWIGWDYAHYSDYTPYPSGIYGGCKKWTTHEIFEEVKDVIMQLKEKEEP